MSPRACSRPLRRDDRRPRRAARAPRPQRPLSPRRAHRAASFTAAMVSLRENVETESLHVAIDGNRVSAHVDEASPLDVRSDRSSGYSMRRALVHNLAGHGPGRRVAAARPPGRPPLRAELRMGRARVARSPARDGGVRLERAARGAGRRLARRVAAARGAGGGARPDPRTRPAGGRRLRRRRGGGRGAGRLQGHRGGDQRAAAVAGPCSPAIPPATS